MSAKVLDHADIRSKLSQFGYAYVDVDMENVDYVTELSSLGPLVPQYDGQLVRDITPDPNVPDDVLSAVGVTALPPHTEWYEFPGLPPRYVVLWCVHHANGLGGETTLADGHRLLGHFTSDERAELSRRVYRWGSRYPEALAKRGIHGLGHNKILDEYEDSVVMRFSTYDLEVTDELSARYIKVGGRFFEENHVAIKIERGTMLIWDNWRMLHSRNAFADRRRHLRRVLIGTVERASQPPAGCPVHGTPSAGR